VPLPGFRIRTLMIAVAVLGLAMGSGMAILRRRADHLRQARFYRQAAMSSGQEGDILIYMTQCLEHERAANRPWLRVPPGPPMPK
jgi:hypothetical protein